MGLFRRAAETKRTYPAAGISVTGRADRFHRAKTSGARDADRAAQAWEDRDRQQDRRGRWYRPAR